MYHLASCLLKSGQPASSKMLLDKVIVEGQNRDHMEYRIMKFSFPRQFSGWLQKLIVTDCFHQVTIRVLMVVQ
jgi:hypothetical protein